MRLNSEARSRLAAEYVLGTLRGRARRRFEQMVREQPELADLVRAWRERWIALYAELPDVQPDPQSWQRIQERLGWAQESSALGKFWNSLPLWRSLTVLAVVAAVSLSALRQPVDPPVELDPPSTLVLVLADEQARVGWVMTADNDRLESRPLRDLERDRDRAYELWLVPPEQRPLSLGLIDPDSSSAFELSPELAQWLRPGATLAVSLEPIGGSATGQPTGPIVYTGQIIEL